MSSNSGELGLLRLLGSTVNPLGGIDVNVQDQTTPIVDRHLTLTSGTFTLTADATLDSNSISISTPGVTGEIVCLKEGTRFYQGIILSHTASRVTLDTPLDYAFTTGSLCSYGSDNANVDGSSTKKIFTISPPSLTKWDVVRAIFHIEDNATMDDGTFGGIAALSKGVIFRHVDGVTNNIFNVKTNGEFAERCDTREYVSKPPSGTGNALNITRTFGGQNRNGVVIRLDGASNDEIQLIVQDNLTALSIFSIIVQGHIVD